MQFLKHSCDMSNDIKILRVSRKYGLAGYGLYNYALERIAKALTSDSPMPELEETAQDIAEQFGTDTLKVNEMMMFMVDQGLFERDEITGRILCHKIYRFIDKSQTRSPEIRRMIDQYKAKKLEIQRLGQSETKLIDKEIDIDKDIEVDKDIDVDVEEISTPRNFAPPTLEQVRAYITDSNISNVDAATFWHFYETRGWTLNTGKKMKSWTSAVQYWARNKYADKPQKSPKDRARELDDEDKRNGFNG